MKARIAVSLSLAGLLLLFQNCGEVRFSETVSSQGSAKLTGLSLEDDEQDMASGQVEQPGAPDNPGKKNDDPPPVAGPSPAPAPAPTPAPGGDGVAGGDSADDHPIEGETPDEDSGLVACILKQHGKSLKLGLIEAELGGVNSVARSVCISRSGCLVLVAAKFEVEGAYDRGYCRGNPNVVRLTDAQLKELLK